jgi:hypothetical protein
MTVTPTAIASLTFFTMPTSPAVSSPWNAATVVAHRTPECAPAD